MTLNSTPISLLKIKMKNYLEDPRLLTLQEIIDDPKNKIKTINFLKGAANKDSIYVHPVDDSKIKKQIYFAFIRASKLKVSRDYQRYICLTTLKKAKQFDYLLCQTLVVALRPDGTYVIIDGQHKAIMAMLSGEDLDIPCQVIIHDPNSTLQQCIEEEAKLFEKYNTSRKNTSTLDKVRAGLSYGDEDAKEFEENWITIGIQSEGIGYDGGVEVTGWAKANESISKWKIVPTKKAVDFLKPVYKQWNLDYMDGSMIGGLAAIQTLLDAVGDGKKGEGLKWYLNNHFSAIARSVWTKNTRGQSDVLIARKIVDDYNNDVAKKKIECECAAIGEDLLKGVGLADPTKLN